MTKEDLLRVEERIGYKFKNLYLLQQAFIRKSFSDENGCQSNEILEFIGDKALDLSVINILMKYYSNVYEISYLGGELVAKFTEGEFTELKRKLVEKKMLARRIDCLQFYEYLIMGNSDLNNDLQNSMSIKEDLFESIIGAVALDCNSNINILEKVVEIMLEPKYYLENGFPEEDENYIGIFQEWHQKKFKTVPLYIQVNNNGVFSATIIFSDDDGNMITVDGQGKTMSSARMAAAKKACEIVNAMDLRKKLLDELGEFTHERAVNQLQELFQKGMIPEPLYHFYSTPNYEEGGTNWQCLCTVSNKDKTFATGSSKKEAKKAAAYEMLNFIFYSGNYSGGSVK